VGKCSKWQHEVLRGAKDGRLEEARGICTGHLNAKHGTATDEFVKEKAQERRGPLQTVWTAMDGYTTLSGIIDNHCMWHKENSSSKCRGLQCN